MIQGILRDIAATQNFQIQGMRSVLEMKNFAQTADCVVEISRNVEMDDSPVTAPVKAPTQGSSGASTTWSSTQMFTVTIVTLLIYRCIIC
jgi:hypothetical protein